MAKQKQQKKLARLRNKFRLVVMNVDSFEERFSLVLSPLNIFTWGGLVLISLIVLTVALIAFTPLRRWIPGYLDEDTRKQATYAALQADSLAGTQGCHIAQGLLPVEVHLHHVNRLGIGAGMVATVTQ